MFAAFAEEARFKEVSSISPHWRRFQLRHKAMGWPGPSSGVECWSAGQGASLWSRLWDGRQTELQASHEEGTGCHIELNGIHFE